MREVQLSTCYLPWKWSCCHTPTTDTAGTAASTAASTGSAGETVKTPPSVLMLCFPFPLFLVWVGEEELWYTQIVT